MASLGAKVLQVRSVEVAMVHNVQDSTCARRSTIPPIPKLGTLICDEEDILEQQVVTGIAFSRDEAQITLRKVADKPGVAAAIFVPARRSQHQRRHDHPGRLRRRGDDRHHLPTTSSEGGGGPSRRPLPPSARP